MPSSSPSISVQQLRHVYPARGGAAPVIANEDISLEVHRGEVVGLLGPNGAGKSTLVLQLIGLLSPTSGRIHIEGVDVVRAPERARQLIGFLPQSGVAMRYLEVRRALSYTGCLRGQDEREATRQAGELMERLEISGNAHRLVNTLSGGQVRLVNFAMALMGRPRVLILDEPTNELDPQKRRLVWELLHHLNQTEGTTCILVTHNLTEAEKVLQRVAVMQHGRILTSGTPGEFKKLFGERVRLELAPREGQPLSEAELASLHELGSVAQVRPGHYRLLFPSGRLEEATRLLVSGLGPARLDDFRLAPPSLEDIYLELDEGMVRAAGQAPALPSPAPRLALAEKLEEAPAVAEAPAALLHEVAPSEAPAFQPLPWTHFPRTVRYLWLEQMADVRATWVYRLIMAVLMPLSMVFGITRIGSGLNDTQSLLYVISGAAVFAVVTEGVASMAQQIGWMKRDGMMLYYASLPIDKIAFVLALLGARFVVLLPGLLTPILAGRWLYGFDIQLGFWVLLLLPLTALSLSALGMTIGSVIESPALIDIVAHLFIFVLLLAAPVFIPNEALPRPLQLLGYVLPPTYAATALRGAFMGQMDETFFTAVGVLVGTTAFGLFALKRWLHWGLR